MTATVAEPSRDQQAARATGPCEGVSRAGALGVCLISEELPPETGWGGIGTYTHNLARGLADLGHRVHVIARCWGEDRTEGVRGVTVHRVAVPEPGWKWGTWWMNLKFAETRQVVWWNVVVSRALARICERERIDVVETPEYHAQGLLATLRQYRLPMIVRLHTPAFVCRELNGKAIGSTAWDTFASEKLEWWLAKRAAVVTSPSRQMAESVAGPWRMGVELIEVVPNPVDDDLFAPGARDGGEAVLLFVGRLERRKGVDTIARALPEIINKHPKARMQFVGNDHPSAPDGGSMQAWVRAYLREQGVGEDRVEFVGPVDRERLPAMYQRAAVCLVPSRYESFGYTCVEAMSCGCATVATRAGALAEIVTDERDGLLVEPDDAAALAQAVTRLLDDRALREGLGRAARETVVARFSRPAVCQQMVDVYLRTVRKSLSV